jgi:DNA-binding beta-propeller fold protein YncE
MKAHQCRITCLGLLVLAFSIAILCVGRTGLAAGGPVQGKSLPAGLVPAQVASSPPASPQVTITASGFDPAVLTVAVGIDVTWINATSETHTLQILEARRIYLPLVMKTSSGRRGAAVERETPIPQLVATPLESDQPISAILPPGGTFSHTFASVGIYSCFLTTAPQLRGQVIVEPGITGGEKPVDRVYQPPLDDPVGLAINGAETVAYVAEKGAGRLVAVDIDPASPTYRATTPIALGLEDLQMGLALDPSETYAYVVENEPGNLKRVNLHTGTVTTITAALEYPHDVALSSDGTQAYVTLNAGALVSVTVATGQVSTVTSNLVRPAGIALTPDGTEALVNEVGGQLQRVNLDTGETEAIGMPGYMPFSIALNPSDGRAYVGFWEKTRLCVVDTNTNQVEQETYLYYRAADIAVNASGSRAYVLWRDLEQIVTMELDTWETIPVETTPILEALDVAVGVTLNATQTRTYVIEQHSGELSRIELEPNSPDYGRPVAVASIGSWEGLGGSVAVSAGETWALVAKAPYEWGVEPTLLRVDLVTGLTSTVSSFDLGPLRGVTLSPDERFAYVTGATTVKQVDLNTGAVQQIGDYGSYGGELNGAALTADGNTLYVAQWKYNRLLRVDVATGAIATVSDQLHLPVAVALAPGETTAWVLEEGKGGMLTQVDLASGALLADVSLQPWTASYSTHFSISRTGCLALKADGSTAYVPMTSGPLNYIYRVDLTGRSGMRVLYQATLPHLRDATLNGAETKAYLVDEVMGTVYQVDTDPASPSFGTISSVADGNIPNPSQVALSPDETTLVVAYENGMLARIRLSDGMILSRHWARTGAVITGLALHPGQPLAYVVVEDGSLRAVDLTVEDSSTLITSGLENPRGLGLNAAGTTAYLVEEGAGRLVSVDLGTGAVTTVATGLVNPLDVALDEIGGAAYVSEYVLFGTPWVRKVNLSTGTLDWAHTGAYGEAHHEAIILSQDRQHLYLARGVPGALWRINLAEATAAAIPPPTWFYPVTYHPESIYEEIERTSGCLSPDGLRLYLGDEDTPRLLALDLTTRRASLVATMDFPLGEIAVAPDGRTAYISRMYDDSLIALNLETGESQTVFTGHAWALALDPTDPGFAYIAQPSFGQVSRLNLSTGIPETLPVQFELFPAAPETMDINTTGTHLYLLRRMVGEMGDNVLIRLDLATYEITPVAVVNSKGEMGRVIAVDRAERYAYVSDVGGEARWSWKRGGNVWRVHIDPASPTYGQVDLVVRDVGEIGVLTLDPTGTRLIVSGGGSYAFFEVD